MKIIFLLVSFLLANTSIAGNKMENEASTVAFIACGGAAGWLLNNEFIGQKIIFTYECSGQKSLVKIECGSSKFSCKKIR